MIKEVLLSQVHKSRLDRACMECGNPIDIGEEYAHDGHKARCKRCFKITQKTDEVNHGN